MSQSFGLQKEVGQLVARYRDLEREDLLDSDFAKAVLHRIREIRDILEVMEDEEAYLE